MDGLEFKSVSTGVEVKDAEQGIVQAIVARTGIPDSDGDLFMPGAFGEQKVRVSAYSHKSWPQKGGEMPVGRGTIREVGDAVVADLQFFMDTSTGREHFAVVKGLGELGEWSYGFLPQMAKGAAPTAEQKSQGVRRVFTEVPVVEVTPTMLGASVGTMTLAVKSEGSEEPEAEVEPEAAPETPAEEPAPDPEADLKEQIAREVARFEAIKLTAGF